MSDYRRPINKNDKAQVLSNCEIEQHHYEYEWCPCFIRDNTMITIIAGRLRLEGVRANITAVFLTRSGGLHPCASQPCQLTRSAPSDSRQSDRCSLWWLPPGAPAAFMIAGGALLEINVQRPAQSAWFAGDAVVGGGHPPTPSPSSDAGVNPPCALPGLERKTGLRRRACVFQ